MCAYTYIEADLHWIFQNINSEFCSIENTDLEQKYFSSFQTAIKLKHCFQAWFLQ